MRNEMNSQKLPRVGIIGKGFVGGAVYDSFHCPKDFNDPDIGGSLPLDELVSFSNYLFVCVPTPTINEKLDSSIVREVCSEIDNIAKVLDTTKVVIIKSTVTPDVLEFLNDTLENIRLVFNPEFLTEANAYWDYVHPESLIFGTWRDDSEGLIRAILELYEHFSYMEVPENIIDTTLATASLIKYGRNTFLATKLIFFNEFFRAFSEIDDKMDYRIDWDKLVEGITSDSRIGESHTTVPGPDNKFGYGGSCFPKDTKALIDFSYSHGSVLDLLETVDRLNERKYGRREDTP